MTIFSAFLNENAVLLCEMMIQYNDENACIMHHELHWFMLTYFVVSMRLIVHLIVFIIVGGTEYTWKN